MRTSNQKAAGATRFNDIRRGVPGISPTLLSKRLKEMERNKHIEWVEDTAKGTVDYVRTRIVIELEPTLRQLGNLALFYQDFGYAPGLVLLGGIGSGNEVFKRPGPLRATIERAE